MKATYVKIEFVQLYKPAKLHASAILLFKCFVLVIY